MLVEKGKEDEDEDEDAVKGGRGIAHLPETRGGGDETRDEDGSATTKSLVHRFGDPAAEESTADVRSSCASD